jgi:hypothetical protein
VFGRNKRNDLERMCSELGIPGDFDVAQISWRPDYDQFFYCQLSRLAHRIYLFRGEYIVDMQKAVVVETPQLGHATYIFAKPRSMETFLALYTRITKEDIRRNRDNIGGTARILEARHTRYKSSSLAQRDVPMSRGNDQVWVGRDGLMHASSKSGKMRSLKQR